MESDPIDFLVTVSDNANNYVTADAIRFVAINNPATTTSLYYIHTDHLGTPRAVTTSDANNTTVWSWNSDPFGNTAANEDPDGDGNAFTMNLRFPGQYYDTETGLHYN